MKLVNASSGKIGACLVGPKNFLHESIRLGEAAICIGREEKRVNKPVIWLIGGVEQLIDYISLARQEGEIEEDIATMLLTNLDNAKGKIPKTAIERLASVINVDADELSEMMQTAQVYISAPIAGVLDFSTAKPTWLPKTQSY